ncbi:NAD(P)H-dependent oxidoreductase [Bordetella pseudohinzii]|uniref:Flagellar biosynthesis protein FlgA n=1 Tax=Bordetella pseudohinzii TaxID=1331258 RepID=A0A0J6BPU7_9BORD|nr:SAF domain-containing protein [Bordetella pseudohinzii]ANY17791.1 flagellar biosynthesis protein FlgA [Bordetella pseudohinzii]KMM23839.1 flagellar basal body P-ring biosynthesis protein FlgA [Bordetella pseudohinzii]KXA75384.1 flagellar biosynthesis protein FlgA [Bordetella pseudohinzii]KXA76215.1 flagellar biosynthesis protein FlgA [Bordetella pseudohinzii]CUI76861.1 Predicted homoserine dehydrogenase [Bordetella pseudohinzii]
MNLHRLLKQREADQKPLKVALIGTGKFSSMFLSQVQRTPGMRLVAVVEDNASRARAALTRSGWPAAALGAASIHEAARGGKVFCCDDALHVIADPDVEIVIDASAMPAEGIAHTLLCCEYRKDIVMVNVAADALAGPLLARRAREAGIIYSLAYGDQPALICEMVDWARACGFEVVAAGKGTKYLPEFHTSTPDTVWPYYGFTDEMVAAGDFDARLFNSFLDGTKSALEMACVSNATGLTPAPQGLLYPPCGVDDLSRVLRPREHGGMLHHRGQVEVVSSLERDGRAVFRDLRWGVYVTLAAGSDFVRDSFRDYGLVTDPSGHYAAMYKPYHLIGMELGVSVASIGLRREPTGSPTAWHADVIATAKRDMEAGEILDGSGGYTVYGRLVPARSSVEDAYLPIGLAEGAVLKHAVRQSQPIRLSDVSCDEETVAARFRREMEQAFA